MTSWFQQLLSHERETLFTKLTHTDVADKDVAPKKIAPNAVSGTERAKERDSFNKRRAFVKDQM